MSCAAVDFLCDARKDEASDAGHGGEHDIPFDVLSADTFATCPLRNHAAIIPNAAHVMGVNTAFGEAVLTFLAEP
jgi:hypothetical protein